MLRLVLSAAVVIETNFFSCLDTLLRFWGLQGSLSGCILEDNCCYIQIMELFATSD